MSRSIAQHIPLPGAEATNLACSLGVSPHYRQEELQRWLSAASVYDEMHPEDSPVLIPLEVPIKLRQRSRSHTWKDAEELWNNGAGGRRVSAFDMPTLSLHKVSTINRSCASTNPGSRGESSLELEAIAAVHELSFAVESISVSEMLPRTPDLIFVNVNTIEGQPYCLELTLKGWRITSTRHDCMIGDFTRLDLFTKYYDNLTDLMETISPGYHAIMLATKLRGLEASEDEQEEPMTPQVMNQQPIYT